MLALDTVRSYGITLDQLSTAALAELRSLMAAVEELAPDRAQAILMEAFPEVFNPYAAAASAVSASFYEEVRVAADARGRYDAGTIDEVDSGRWGSLVGFGTAASVFEKGGAMLAFSLLSGGLTQVLTEMASDTIVGNASLDPVTVGYQRVASPGCCAFCGMLASRTTSLYQSREAANGVVGRGTPVPKHKQRGGQARGIRPRGARGLGERYHDHCKCKGVPVFAGQEVEMERNAAQHFDAYADARDKVSDYRKTQGYVGFGDQAESQKLILAEMRKSLGTK